MSDPPHPFQFAPAIPAILWDPLEEALKANVRRLVKDIANTLGQPDAPLLNALLKPAAGAAVVRPYLFEEGEGRHPESDCRCDFICQRPDAPKFLQMCAQPIVWTAGVKRCAQHLYSRPVPQPAGLLRLIPLEQGGLDCPLYRAEDGTVYDAEFEPRGFYDVDAKRLRLFVMEEDTP